MSYVVSITPRLLDPETAVVYCGGAKILAALRVKPRVQGKGLTRYDRLELDAALDRWRGFDDDGGAS